MSLAGWQRVSLPMLVLDVLAVAPRHGYGISQALVSAGLQPTEEQLTELGISQALVSAGLQPTEEQLTELHAQWQAFITAAEALSRTD